MCHYFGYHACAYLPSCICMAQFYFPYWHCYFRRHCIHCQVVCCGLVMFPHVDFNRKVSTGLTGLCEFLQSIGIFLREWCVDDIFYVTAMQGRYLHLSKTMLRLPCPIGRVEEALHHILSFLETYVGLSGWQYIQLAVYQLLRPHYGVVMCSPSKTARGFDR